MASRPVGGKKYLVTGGAGFIGSHLAARLLKDGHQVWVVDDLSTGKLDNVPAGADFLELDISRSKSYQGFPPGKIDAVLHLAAQSSGEISDADPVADLKANTLGTVRLLDWCLSRGTRRFVFAGTMGVYGHAADLPVTEESPCRPASFYGASKLAAEEYIRLYADKGLQTTIFRIFNAYGPGQNLSNLKQGMISIYLAYLAQQKPIVVKGSVDRFRDFIYIDDLIDVWIRSIDAPETFGRTYNLAGGGKTLVKGLLAELLRAWGAPADYPIEPAAGTPGDVFGIYADITRLSKELDWRPRVDLPVGLGRMVAWAQSSAEDV